LPLTARMLGLSLLIPPLEEQRAIVAYLDRETDEMDTLIAKKERFIALLAEKRTALISHAVTRGLNPAAPLKPSGVEWLGDIPSHWIVRSMKRYASFRSGDAITATDIDEIGEYPVYGGNGLRGYTKNYSHEGEFVLIGRQGALCGNINYARGRFWASEHAVVATPICQYSTVYFGEMLRAMNLNQYSFTAAQPGLAVEYIQNLKVPTPPLEEQREIAAFLDRQTEKIDRLIATTRRHIERLRERRSALISAAVTGKINVSL